MSSEYGKVLLQMATQIFGEPTNQTNKIVRFKRSQGVAVNTADGTWFDFTENVGGGVVDFAKEHFPNQKISEVIKQFGGADFTQGMWEGVLQQS